MAAWRTLAGWTLQRTTRATDDRAPGEQNLVLYHLGGHGHIGARLSRYDLLRHTINPDDASAVWPFEARTLTTRTGQPLARALLDWLRGTLGTHGAYGQGPSRRARPPSGTAPRGVASACSTADSKSCSRTGLVR